MKAEARTFLFDALQAAGLIQEFCRDKTFEQYRQDIMLRSAVERQFEIIGEALSQLSRLEKSLAARIPDAPRIVAFRNVLIHSYAKVSHTLVWSVVIDDLPALIDGVRAVLESTEE